MTIAPDSGVMLQGFHLYTSHEGNHWRCLQQSVSELVSAGFSAVWLPPAFKGAGGDRDLGYGVYDFYDLGEFDQKGTVRTKYGTRSEYLATIESFRAAGIQVYVDIVIDHLIGGDFKEHVRARAYSNADRNFLEGDMYDANVQTHFAYEARKGKYSAFQWHWHHFNATDYNLDHAEDKATILVFEGKSFNQSVSLEKGNFDYLMGCNIDFTNDETKTEIKNWGEWYLETTKADGVRIDAAKHVSYSFMSDFINCLNENRTVPLFVMAEYWEPQIESLNAYIDNSGGNVRVFDSPLHYNFSNASKTGSEYDISTIFHGTLIEQKPMLAVTFVDNHDTQPLGTLESDIEPWFKPLAYTLILLRREGYPCVFYPDFYGAEYAGSGRDGSNCTIIMPSFRILLTQLMYARGNHCFGEQRDYFDHPNTIGWTFSGNGDNPRAMGVLLSNSSDGYKKMAISRANRRFVDLTGNISEVVVSDSEGNATFTCKGKSVSIWIEEYSE